MTRGEQEVTGIHSPGELIQHWPRAERVTSDAVSIPSPISLQEKEPGPEPAAVGRQGNKTSFWF